MSVEPDLDITIVVDGDPAMPSLAARNASGEVSAQGRLYFQGGSTEAGTPRFELADVRGIPSSIIEALVTQAEKLALESGASRLVVPAPIEDAALIRCLESLGYRPGETGPYRELGPGVVEPLIGYTGIEGFQVDYVRAVGAA